MFPFSTAMYVLESIILAVYLICMEVPNARLQEKETQVYREMLVFFSRVKHRYTSSHCIANAVLDASDGMQYEICRLAEEIYRVLMEADRKEKIRDYASHGRINRYMKLFLIQTFEVSEKGDYFFAENVEHLRLEMMEELYRRRRCYHEFSGYVFVAVAPFFLMPVLKQWGIDFSPELQLFYSGTGRLLEGLVFGVTLIVYGMIQRAKEITFFGEGVRRRNRDIKCLFENPVLLVLYSKLETLKGNISKKLRQLLLEAETGMSFGQLCVRMSAMALTSFFVMLCFFTETHEQERKAILESVDAIDIIAPVASEQKKTALAEQILAVTRQCIFCPDCSAEEIKSLFRNKIHLENSTMEQAAVQEIQDKLQRYKKNRCSLYEIFLCLFGSVVFGMFPVWKLQYEVRTMKKGARYEVRQFQSLIMMERKLEGVTVMGLLEDMEIFSRCFRKCLRRCINSYGADPKGALELLKKEGGQLQAGFEELADAFLSVDEVGIERAFEEVESNRRLLEKMTQLEAEIHMERKKDITDIIVNLPMILAVGGYFILPFFMCSLRGVKEVFELLEKL